MPDEALQEEWRVRADKAICLAIGRGLAVTGVAGREVVLFFMERRFSLPADRMPDDPEGVVFALRSILHHGAANVLDSIIVELRNHNPHSDREREFIASFTSVLRDGQLSVESRIEWPSELQTR